jgi:high-affinity Fe2+/Pb2+ permease
MKLGQFCKYMGLISGGIGALFILGGIIGYFIGEFMGVKSFSWFFWAANTFILFAIFGMVVHISCSKKEDKQ